MTGIFIKIISHFLKRILLRIKFNRNKKTMLLIGKPQTITLDDPCNLS